MNTLFYEKRRDERKQLSLSPAVSKTSVVIFSKVALLRSEEQTKLQSWSFVDQVQYDWLLLLVCIDTSNVSPNYGRTLFHLLRQFVKDIARRTILLPGDHSQCVRCHRNCSFYLHSTAHSTAHSTQHRTATSASKWLINIIFHSLSQLFARSKSGFFKEIADPVVCECHHGLTTTVAGVCPNIWHTVKLVLIIVLEVLIWLELELRAT